MKMLLTCTVIGLLFSQCVKQQAKPGLDGISKDVTVVKDGKTLLDTLPRKFPVIPSPISDAFVDEVAKIVAPAREALMAVVTKDKSGLFDGYLKDVTAIKELKSAEEQRKMLDLIRSKYYGFIKEAWVKAGIKERSIKNRSSLLCRTLFGGM